MRHAAHYLTVLRKADNLYLQGGEAIKRGLALFDLEWRNVQQDEMRAGEQLDGNSEAAKLSSDYPYAGAYLLSLRQHPRERIFWLETALGAARRLKDRTVEGVHLGNLGIAYTALGEIRRAIEFHERYFAIAREIGDRRGEGTVFWATWAMPMLPWVRLAGLLSFMNRYWLSTANLVTGEGREPY